MRILLVEDDPRIANFVAKGLREQAYAVDVAANGEDALYQASINPYDLAILDVLIPAPDGFEVCRRLRQSGLRFPILMLTARDATDDRVQGLDTGADDYLTKPFEFRELLARLRALLRRSGELRPNRIAVEDLVLDTGGADSCARGKANCADHQGVRAARISGAPCGPRGRARRNFRTCLGRNLRSIHQYHRGICKSIAAQNRRAPGQAADPYAPRRGIYAGRRGAGRSCRRERGRSARRKGQSGPTQSGGKSGGRSARSREEACLIRCAFG